MLASVSGARSWMVVPLPVGRADVDGAFEPIHHRANHIHADAAAGDFGDCCGGAEARLKNQIQNFVFGKALALLRPSGCPFRRLAREACVIHAAAIVANFDDDLRALMIGVEKNGSARRFCRRRCVRRRVQCRDRRRYEPSASTVRRARRECLYRDRCSGRTDLKRHVFAALFRDVAHNARKAAEKLLDRHHANLQNAFVQFVEDARLKGHGVGQFGAHRIARVALSNSVSVRLSMDLPMISSPTRFITASMRAASTRREVSVMAATAEPTAFAPRGWAVIVGVLDARSRPALPGIHRAIRARGSDVAAAFDAKFRDDRREFGSAAPMHLRLRCG